MAKEKRRTGKFKSRKHEQPLVSTKITNKVRQLVLQPALFMIFKKGGKYGQGPILQSFLLQ
jgi:hypothetical protein